MDPRLVKSFYDIDVCLQDGVTQVARIKESLDLIIAFETIKQSSAVLKGPKIPENIRSDVLSCSIQYHKGNLKSNVSDYRFHFYTLNGENGETEILDMEGDESEMVKFCQHWILPSKEFHLMWENLYYDSEIKQTLLNFLSTSLLFASREVDTNIIECNRLILLHGPPGTGKTSLCKALAQKTAIQYGELYKFVHLVEINTHSLFSKWFSESGKLVAKMFNQIQELVDNRDSLIFVLIDEVESIAYSRKGVTDNEPTDSLRVVNSVLMQLDKLRKYQNVLILATSNLTSAIDPAFLDRADICQYIGYPSADVIKIIYEEIFKELIRVGIVIEDENKENETLFSDIVSQSEGLSCRSLRKIPFLAIAKFHNHQNVPYLYSNFLQVLSDHVVEFRQSEK